MNDILWSFWTLYISLLFYTLGFFAAIVLTVESVMEDLSYVTVPAFLLIYLALFCAIGQHVKDSAAEVGKAAYNCQWYEAPLPFRKLVLMLLIRSTVEVKLDAKPFFEMDYVLFKKVGVI